MQDMSCLTKTLRTGQYFQNFSFFLALLLAKISHCSAFICVMHVAAVPASLYIDSFHASCSNRVPAT